MMKYLVAGLLSNVVFSSGLVLAAPVALEMDRGKPGEAKPLGWLKAWSRLAADGYAGCMDEVDPEFARAWKAEFRPRGGKLDWMAAPDGSWSAEGGAYWFDGLVRLAEQLDDSQLRELAKRRIEPVLDNMNAKSVLFNWWLDRDKDEERGWVYRTPAIWQMWASGISERAVAAYLDVTGDGRAKRALAFAFDDPRLFTEAKVRKAPAAQAVFEAAWLTGDAGVRATADVAARDPMPAFSVPPKEGLADTLHWKRPDIRKAHATRHGVTTAEALLSVLRAYRWSGERKYLDAVLAWFAFLDRYTLQPYGVTVSDEEWGWAGASRGSETCTVAAEPWTRTELMMLPGDGSWGDAVERAFFNAAPNCVSHDFRRHVYLQTANRTDVDDFRNVSAYRDFAGMKEHPTRFARKHYPLCCTAALNRLVPNYVQSMWMKSADGGVVAALYGPSSFATDLPSGRVALRETTDYPFSETIRIAVESAPSSPFALKLRIPGWCEAPTATLNGTPLELRAERGFASVVRTWRAGDEVTLRLPMRPKRTTLADRNDGGRLRASVSCGPLLYAFALPEEDENTPQAGWTEPTLGARSLEGAEVVRTPLPSGWTWSREAPVRLKVRDAQGRPLELVPYGCAKLYVTLFAVSETVR